MGQLAVGCNCCGSGGGGTTPCTVGGTLCSVPNTLPVTYSLFDQEFDRNYLGTMTYGPYSVQGGGTVTGWSSPWQISPTGADPCAYYRVVGICPSPAIQLAADADGTICDGIGVVSLTMICEGHDPAITCDPYTFSFSNGSGCFNPAGMLSGVFTQ